MLNRVVRLSMLAAVVFAVTGWAQEAPKPAEPQYRSVEALRKGGMQRCAGALARMTRVVFSDDEFGYVNFFNKESSDTHLVVTFASRKFSDATGVATIAVTPTIQGSCDGHYTYVFALPESCAKVRDTTFQEWKFYTDLKGGTTLYERPDTIATVSLTPTANNGCLMVKSGVAYLQP